jgi:two-component system sensor histidine kinase UhpB
MSTLFNRNEQTKVWILEDNPGDQILLCETLIEINFKAKNFTIFKSLSEFHAAIKNDEPDILLMDLSLPDSSGLKTIKSIVESTVNFPIIVLSGLKDMDAALESVKIGAQDYLLKDELNNDVLNKMINYAIERFSNLNELRKSEERYKLLFQNIPIPVISLDERDEILDYNNASKELLQLNGELSGRHFFSLFAKNAIDFDSFSKILSGNPHLLKIDLNIDQKKYIEFSSVESDSKDKSGHLVSLLDRTAIIENELDRSRIVHETLDEERSRFSKELHDGVAQYLVVLHLNLQMLQGHHKKVDESLKNCIEIANTSVQMVRSISYNLSPPDIQKGLLPALKALFNRLKVVNKCTFNLVVNKSLNKYDLSSVDEYNVYRIIQEFVNNSIKYSDCGEVKCTITILNSRLNIEISDNGKGFDTTKQGLGIGLSNMKQRAFAAGFTFTLKSALGKGTSMQLISEQELIY